MSSSDDGTGGRLSIIRFIDFKPSNITGPGRALQLNLFGLFTAILGGMALAFYTGIARVVDATGDAWARVFEYVARVLTTFINVTVGQEGIFEVAWVAARADVAGSGIAAFAIGVAVVGLTSLVYSWGVSLLE